MRLLETAVPNKKMVAKKAVGPTFKALFWVMDRAQPIVDRRAQTAQQIVKESISTAAQRIVANTIGQFGQDTDKQAIETFVGLHPRQIWEKQFTREVGAAAVAMLAEHGITDVFYDPAATEKASQVPAYTSAGQYRPIRNPEGHTIILRRLAPVISLESRMTTALPLSEEQAA